MIDLGDFIAQFTEHPLTESLLQAIEEAVPRLHYGTARSGSTGFSVYFPYYAVSDFAERQSIYSTLTVLPAYRKFTEEFKKWLKETELNITFDSPMTIAGDGEFEILLRDEDLPNIKTVNYICGILRDNGDIDGIGFDNDVGFNTDTNTVFNRSTGFWLGLNNHLAAITITEETEDYNLYSIPILLNGTRVSVQGAWFWDDLSEHGGYYDILGVWAGIDENNKTVDRDMKDVAIGDTITMLYTKTDLVTGEVTYVEGDTFIMEDELVFDDVVLPPGKYVYAFEIVDVANKSYISDYVTIEWTKEQYEKLMDTIKHR